MAVLQQGVESIEGQEQYAGIPHIDTVEPLGVEDLPGLEAALGVIERHGMQDRAALVLTHNHFDLEPGETLATTQVGDSLVTQPVAVGDIDPAWGAVVTEISLDETVDALSFPLSLEGRAARLFPRRSLAEDMGDVVLGGSRGSFEGLNEEHLPLLQDLQAALREHGLAGRFSLTTDLPWRDLDPAMTLLETHPEERVLVRQAVDPSTIELPDGDSLMVTNVDFAEMLEVEDLVTVAQSAVCIRHRNGYHD